MALSLTATQQSLHQLFETSDQYVIPDFQRPYTWEYDEAYQLYTDLTSAFHRNGEDYFLGSILLARGKDNPKQPIIIDGQQRLVTLWIIMKVLSIMYPDYVTFPDMLQVNMSLRENKKESKILSGVQEVEDQNAIRDILKADYETFERELIRNKKEHKDDLFDTKLGKNALELFRWFNDYKNRDAKELEDFCDYFLEHVFMLPIELTGETIKDATDRTLTIFETLNNRGKELDDAYIFKARLYSMAKNIGAESQFMEEWTIINETCTTLNIKLDELFRYYSHIIRSEEGITTSEVGLREFFTGGENTPLLSRGVKKVMEDLNKIMEILLYVERIRKENSFNTRWFQIIDAYTNTYPRYAIVVFLYYRGLESPDFPKFMQDLIRLCYLYGSSASVKFPIYTLIRNIYAHGQMDLFWSYENHFHSMISNPRRLRKGLLLLLLYQQVDDKICLSYYTKKLYSYHELTQILQEDEKPKIVENSLENNYIVGPMQKIGTTESARYDAADIQIAGFKDIQQLEQQRELNQIILTNFFFSTPVMESM